MSSSSDAPIRLQHGSRDTPSASIVIPTFNGAKRIGKCLEALLPQALKADAEVIVVDDGSTDLTVKVVAEYPSVRLISQRNAGPAAARNRGALEAAGSILLFTDDDCVPEPGWLSTMLRPFSDIDVVGAKGAYRTQQRQIVARFVQLEYEDKYRFMASRKDIDFIDTYSGAYRRDQFLQMNGYDTSFPVACAEDIELSYRMSALGWKMRFVPEAIVYHTHPASLANYLKKKYKFAYWRMLAIRKNPGKGVKDSHTPQLMKLQILLLPMLAVAGAIDIEVHRSFPVFLVTVAGAFLVSTTPFIVHSFAKDPMVALISPALLAARACAQLAGVAAGIVNAWRAPAEIKTSVPPKELGN